MYTPSSGLYGVGSLVIQLINNVFVPVIFAIAFIVFLYGVARTYIFSHGEPGEVEEGHKIILWSLIGFFVMLSIWGLVNVLSSTLGLNRIEPPATPTFTPQR